MQEVWARVTAVVEEGEGKGNSQCCGDRMMNDKLLPCDVVQVSRKILSVIIQGSYQAYSREY
jgi:hypothetical protein